jgi:cob(I)alamin adenosyltransferase
MPKAPRIYTRTGDDGTTGLVGGTRVKKNSPRIESYGTLDELSSHIGLARTALRGFLEDEQIRHLDEWLAWTQDALFNLGSELATPAEKRWEGMPLDEAQAQLEPLRNFIHPGGSPPGAHLHVARTVCRRAERLIISLREDEPEISEDCVRYVNRLSDALFVWARWINHRLNVPEHIWSTTTQAPRPQ